MPFVSSVSTTLPPMIFIAAWTAARSPSASCSRILRTRIQRPGMSERSAIARRAAAAIHGKYWSELTSSVTARSSRNGHPVGPVAEDAAPEVGDRDERTGVALLGEPLEVGEVLGMGLAHALEESGQRTGRARLRVDLLRGPVAGDDLEEVVDDPGPRIEQQRVEIGEPVAGDREAVAEVHRHGHGALLAAARRRHRGHGRMGRLARQSSIRTSSSYSSSFIPNQCSGWGNVRSVTSRT